MPLTERGSRQLRAMPCEAIEPTVTGDILAPGKRLLSTKTASTIGTTPGGSQRWAKVAAAESYLLVTVATAPYYASLAFRRPLGTDMPPSASALEAIGTNFRSCLPRRHFIW